MTVKEYNEVWYPLINNSAVFLGALEHNIKKAESPEEALANLRILGWGPELKKFMNDAVNAYQKELLSQIKANNNENVAKTEIKRISNGQMPPANKYVLICLSNWPWIDPDDQSGVCWRVAKCVYGISKAERTELAQRGSFRAKEYKFGDEEGKNLKPYAFEEFGPSKYFGQAVDVWCDLPVIE